MPVEPVQTSNNIANYQGNNQNNDKPPNYFDLNY